MVTNNISKIREEAKQEAIKKTRKELKKNKDFYLLKKLELLIKNGQI